MINLRTPDGQLWTCVRHNHDHKEGGGNVPCAACWPYKNRGPLLSAEDQLSGHRSGDALRSWVPGSHI